MTGIIFLWMSAILPATAWAWSESSMAQEDDRSEFVHRAGVDLLTGNSGNSLRLHMTFGYQFGKRFWAGIGTGYTFYRDPSDLVPVYLDLVYHWRDGDVVPFIQLKAGSSFSILRDRDMEPDRHSGGFTLNPGMGFLIRNNDRSDIYLSAGFNMDHASREWEAFGDRINRDTVSFRRISLSAGFLF